MHKLFYEYGKKLKEYGRDLPKINREGTFANALKEGFRDGKHQRYAFNLHFPKDH